MKEPGEEARRPATASGSEAVRESEARFRELADTAPALLWMTDSRGRMTFVNEGWLRFTGRTLEEELGETFGMSAHPDDRQRLLARWREALAGREQLRMEYRLRRHDGTYRWVLEVGVPRYSGGDFVGYVGTAIDIHQRKSMEQSLRRVYEREHRIAETLQRSLLPERLPAIEGLELAARYLPAGRGADIGGDWYDAVELQDGRVGLVVGDVVGHGLRAAAAMGQLRTAFRAYTLMEGSPAGVLARINRLVMSGEELGMATVLYLLLDRDLGEVVFASAGHPPPLVLSSEGARFLEGGRSVPVGATEAAVFREAREALSPGSTLLLYTDGLVERRGTPLEISLEELAASAEAGAGPLEDLCDQVLSAVLGRREPTDDVALLAVRLAPSRASRLALALPARPDTLASLRRRLGRFLRGSGASEDEVYEISLSISEAAANAIEHAYGPEEATFQVEAELLDGALVASVRDFGRWRERRGEAHGRGLRIIEGLMDEVELSTEGEGTVVRMRRGLPRSRAPVSAG